MDNVQNSNTTLLLRLLILKLLYADVTSLLPHVTWPFYKRSKNRVWSSKRIGFIDWRLGGPDSPIQIKLFRGKAGVCGLGSIRCVLIFMMKDKIIPSPLLNMYRIQGLSSLLTITQVIRKVIPILFRGAINNPVYTFYRRLKFYNFDINWGGWDDTPRHVKFGIG